MQNIFEEVSDSNNRLLYLLSSLLFLSFLLLLLTAAPLLSGSLIKKFGPAAISQPNEQGFEKNTVDKEPKYLGYIIEFEKEPSVKKKKALAQSQLISYAKTLTTESARLENLIKATLGKSAIKNATARLVENQLTKPTELSVMGRYTKTFFGVALNITDQEAEKVKKIPGVKSVSKNYEVKANLMDAVPLIGADQVWRLKSDGAPCTTGSPDCLTGRGVKIAIIDSGIDYTHPDLGGCLGATCKVIGGYDFFNGDNDPMDDNGHGTHVAGIAAGNGVLKGVAPDAKLVSYKVFNSAGSGLTSDVKLAVEETVDPNNDGNFSDNLADVINYSGGRECTESNQPCGPDDPLSITIDNATMAGITVVVAAGNGGSYNTITSPGTARKAISVGASSRSDQIATFGSKGPVIWKDVLGKEHYLMKPDIVAPGVSICSSEFASWYSQYRCFDDKHIAISGTSMATPLVAGAAALLKQKNPTWVPEEIKFAFKNTAKVLRSGFESQGSGRLDVLKAVQLTRKPLITDIDVTFSSPAIVNISGTAKGDNFKNYIIYYGRGQDYSGNITWTAIKQDTSQVINNFFLQNFDISSFGSGVYYFKVEAFNTFNEKSLSVTKIYTNVPLSVKVDSPDGGQMWLLGTVNEIKWSVNRNLEYSDLNSVWLIDYNNPSAPNKILLFQTQNSSYIWTIPPTVVAGSKYKIRVELSKLGETVPLASDESDNYFTINPIALALTSPNGSETWTRGQNANIAWTSNYADIYYIYNLYIWLMDYANPSAPPVETQIGIRDRYARGYTWTIPSTIATGSKYKIKVGLVRSGETVPLAPDESDNYFTIQAPICTPNWQCGAWSQCTSAGQQTRTCTDSNNCGTNEGKPPTTQTCTPPSSVTVTSPNGGETWTRGQNASVTWTTNYTLTTGDYINVWLMDLTNISSPVNVRIGRITSPATSYSWTVPNTQTVGSKYKVRVELFKAGGSSPAAYDDSNNYFTIQAPAPTLTVTSPNGGETWTRGQRVNTTWTTNYTLTTGDYIDVWLLNQTNISSPINVRIGRITSPATSYSWTVPNTQTLGSKYKLRLILIKSGSTAIAAVDDSDNYFTITGSTLTVTSPNGGETWTRGQNASVTWTTNYTLTTGDYIDVWLLNQTNTSAPVNTRIGRITSPAASYSWTVPNTQTLGLKYKLRLILIKSGSTAIAAVDDSDNYFSIAAPAPTITVTFPNGGEQFAQGSAQTITWASTGLPAAALVNITLMDLNTSSSSRLANSVPVSSGSYNWAIPATLPATSKYKILIETVAGTTPYVWDQSNNYFSVTETIIGSTLKKCADIDGDGVISQTDAIFVNNRLGKCSGAEGYDAKADINGDNCITPTDAIYVINRLGKTDPNCAVPSSSLGLQNMFASISDALNEVARVLLGLLGK